MQKNEILIVLGMTLYFLTKIVEWFIWDITLIIKIILYISAGLLIVLGYILDKGFIMLLKNLTDYQKMAYLLLLFINIVIIGYVNITSSIVTLAIYLFFTYSFNKLIYKYVK